MIITCDECDSSFVLDDSLLKPGGSKVRCSSCGNIFIAQPSTSADEPTLKPIVKPPPKKTASVKKKAAAPVAEAPVAPTENDPELTKAVEQIVEDELIFTENELMEGEPTPKAPEEPIADQADEIPQIEIDESIEEEEIIEDDDEILDFSDFELDMDESSLPGGAPTATGSEITDEDDLDFTDLDLDDESQAPPAHALGGEIDLQLDDEEDLYSDDDDLDFSDLEAELDGSPQKAKDSGAGFDNEEDLYSDDDDLDFSDLELELDAPQEPKVSDISDDNDINLQLDEDAEEEIYSDDDLDFSDLALDLDDDSADMDETVESLELDLDESSDDTETMMIEDEFDFSDLEAELDYDSSDITKNEPAEIEDLELDLELESETINIEDDDLDLSDFELDLDEDDTATDATLPPAIPGDDLELDLVLEDNDSAGDDDLDFSDLANMLDNEPQGLSSSDDDSLDLDLDLDLDDELDLAIDDDQPGTKPAGDEELDFSDLENILDDVDTTTGSSVHDGPGEDIELELDLDMDDDSDLDLSSDTSDDLDDGSFDFSDVEAMLEADDGLDEGEDLELDLDSSTDDDLAGIDFDDNGDIDLELSIDEQDEFDEEDDFIGDETIDTQAEGTIEATGKTLKLKKKKKDKPKRKASGKGKFIFKLLIAIIILLLVAVCVFLSSGKIKNITGFMLPEVPSVEIVREKIIDANLPFVSDWVKVVDQDPKGILGLKTSNITGAYFTNNIAGDLFIIKGKIQNTYPDTRNSISLRCNLLNAAGKVTKSEFVYAGNTLSDEKLKTLDIATIKKLLKQRLGTNNNNAKVRPGQMLPFVVVFDNLKEDFTEFSVEPEGSLQGAAIK